jgi:regulator of sirC expression with transglutaminase-like and TPR domain
LTPSSLISALLDLLLDDDPKTQGAVREQFRRLGAEGLAALDAAEDAADPRTRLRARQLAWQLRTDAIVDAFEGLLRGPKPDLEEAVILLARLERPEVDAEAVRVEFDRLGRAVAAETDSCTSAQQRARALAAVLKEQEGFEGDAQDYYDPRNSYIDQVLARRCGIPISLSVVYILAGRRAGLDLVGVGMPMHFLTALREGEERVLIDPFGGGRIMTREACRVLLSGLKQSFRDEYLSTVSDRRMLRRMLANLVHAYQRRGDSLRLGRLFHLVNVLQESSR